MEVSGTQYVLSNLQISLLLVLYFPLLVALNFSCVPVAGDSFRIWPPNFVAFLLLRGRVYVPSP